MGVTAIMKQPAEVVRSPVLPGVAAIAPVTVTAIARGLVPGAAPIGATAELANGAVSAVLAGGSDGERYLITIRATDAASAVHEAELEVAVVDAQWTMPDGSVAYLTIAEFVDYFTLEEVVRMTDLDNSGRIDRTYLVSALRAAQGIVNGNLAVRYAVPIATVPDLVKTATADIARARLYPRGAPEGVATAAKEATRMLERIASGALPLPLEGGAVAEAAVTEAPVLIAPGERRYPTGSRIGW